MVGHEPVGSAIDVCIKTALERDRDVDYREVQHPIGEPCQTEHSILVPGANARPNQEANHAGLGSEAVAAYLGLALANHLVIPFEAL